MDNPRKVITICFYDSSKGQPGRFAAFDESASMINPIAETYAVLIDNHYLLRTRNLDVDKEFGITDVSDVAGTEKRLMEMLYKGLPEGNFVLKVTSQSLIDRLGK